MEIERKYLIDTLPEDYQDYPCRHIEQAYLNTDPVIRIRKDNNKYELTYKSKGLMAREEYNLPLMIPLNDSLTIELDVFEDDLAPLLLAEVEFPDEASALSFTPPEWFGTDVTFSSEYHNSTLSLK